MIISTYSRLPPPACVSRTAVYYRDCFSYSHGYRPVNEFCSGTGLQQNNKCGLHDGVGPTMVRSDLLHIRTVRSAPALAN